MDARGLYKDKQDWVNVDFGSRQQSMSKADYEAAGFDPPYEKLPYTRKPLSRTVSPEYWLARAEEARMVREMFHNREAVAVMTRIVEQYEALADDALKGQKHNK